MDSKILLGLLIAVTVVLAGCHAPEDNGEVGDDGGDSGDGGDGGNGNTTEPTNLTFDVEDAPMTWSVAENLTLTVNVDGSDVTSMHSGFHYGFNSSADEDPSNYTQVLDQTSPHVTNETTYPGSYTVENWTFDESRVGQTVYARAHVNANGEDFWGDEFSFLLAP